MAISSNSIIHFTKEKDNLKGILSSNFKIKYCNEICNMNNIESNIYVPMVSFCDIPLSAIKNHIDSYGKYGIGLTKKWAIKNKLNPVLYIEKHSQLTKSIKGLSKVFGMGIQNSADFDITKKAYLDIFRYSKNYQGDLVRKGKPIQKNYKFYDEREWRYVPDHNNEFSSFIYNKKNDDKIKEKVEIETKKLSNTFLNFEPNDIKYIIINNDHEIDDFLKVLHDAKSGKYLPEDIKRLSTRIITTEQIESDF